MGARAKPAVIPRLSLVQFLEEVASSSEVRLGQHFRMWSIYVVDATLSSVARRWGNVAAFLSVGIHRRLARLNVAFVFPS